MSFGRRKGFEPVAIIGLIATVALHGGVILGILLYRKALMAAEPPPEPHSYVVAKLLRLGKPRDPNKLPDKIVPKAALKKREGIDLSADANDAPSRKKKPKDRFAHDSDRMRRSLDKAALLAAAQAEIAGEGSPEGVAGGTAKTAGEGDPYMTKIADLWNRHWALPGIIPRAEARKLYVLVTLRMDKKGRIQFPLKFDRKSGNGHFDNSITAGWTSIDKIPVPPPDRFASILANGLKLKLNWKGLQ